jgi:quercetin dioxygenase-like cupin family protein
MHDLSEVFAVLAPDQRVTAVPVTPTIYEQLDRDFGGFRGHVLVAKYAFDADWPTWERHPAGDEIVVLLSGAAELVLDRGGSRESMSLAQPGRYVIVPKGTWHTARIAKAAEMLFITPGEGTENEVRA